MGSVNIEQTMERHREQQGELSNLRRRVETLCMRSRNSESQCREKEGYVRDMESNLIRMRAELVSTEHIIMSMSQMSESVRVSLSEAQRDRARSDAEAASLRREMIIVQQKIDGPWDKIFKKR